MVDLVASASQWTLPEWLGVIGGVIAITSAVFAILSQVLKWLGRRFGFAIARHSAKMMLLRAQIEFKDTNKSLDNFMTFIEFPSLFIAYAARLFSKVLILFSVGATTFALAPTPFDFIMSGFIFLLCTILLLMISREFRFHMRMSDRIERLIRILEKTKKDFPFREAEIDAKFDEMISTARNMYSRAQSFEEKLWSGKVETNMKQNSLSQE